MLYVRYIFAFMIVCYSLACANFNSSDVSDYGHLSLSKNQKVNYWLDHYHRKDRYGMNKSLQRAAKFTALIRARLRSENMPEELAYLPIIESGFRSHAKSGWGAVGHWQFVSNTAKSYDLKINRHIDERKDISLATEAAIKHLKRLYRIFGDWHLALAAYNAGEGRIKGFIRKYKTKNYFKLIKNKAIPTETKNYVAKFIAVALIAKNPKKYGFTKYKARTNSTYQVMTLNKSSRLSELSKALGIPRKDLKALNPKFKGDYIPVSKGKAETIHLPKKINIAALSVLKKKHNPRKPSSFK